MDLDVSNPAQVEHQSVLDADLGVGTRHLVVISGIGRPEMKTDDHNIHGEGCRLRLWISAAPLPIL